MARPQRRQGVVLLVVLFFSLLLTSSIATFTRRATIDSMIARNRDAAAQAEALARGGVRLATALLIQDRAAETASTVSLDTQEDGWAKVRYEEIPAGGGSLRLRIDDGGARLNLNALIDGASGTAFPRAEPFLEEMLTKIIDEMEIPPGENLYDERELTENLIDWIDADSDRVRGGPEDAYYQSQDPPYQAPNRPLLSVDELRLIEGFDGPLVEALRPYVTVYPYVLGGGVNLNTAPPHVLSLLFFDDGADLRLADEGDVRSILRILSDGGALCPEGATSGNCTPLASVVTNEIFPTPTFSSNVFTVTSEASVGEVTRTVEAVVDRGPEEPEILSWRTR